MKNVLLVQIQNVIADHLFLPLSSGYLWAYAMTDETLRNNYDLVDVLFTRKNIDKYLDKIQMPEVVGISTYVWNWEYSKEIAKEIKRRSPQTLIVMGGPHISYEVDFKSELPFVDVVVTFGGEQQFAEILKEALNPRPCFSQIEGLLTQDSTLTTNIRRKRVEAIDHFPSPYLSGFFDKIIMNNRDLKFNMIIETNRGCPYQCAFCDMQDSYYQKITSFALDRVQKELEWASHHKISYIECADSNFGIFKRDIEIAHMIAHLKNETGYPKMFNFTSAKNQPKFVEQIQKILGAVNIDRGISVSLQSLNEPTQKVIKRWNKSIDDIELTIESYQKQNLECYIELILGLPLESKESWFHGINYLLDAGFENALLIHPLSVVPNTPFTDVQYINDFDLKYTKTRSPAQGFCYGTESPNEREQICFSSSTMPPQDWIDSYIYSKCIVGAHFFHGLSYYVVKYLKREHSISIGDFYSKLFSHYKNDSSYFNKKYQVMEKEIRETLFQLRPWGSKIFGDDDMYWSDQAAAAMSLISDCASFYQALFNFITHTYKNVDQVQLRSVIDFNKDMLERPNINYPYQARYHYNWHSYFKENQVLQEKEQEVTFNGTNWDSVREHGLQTYWYGRKSKRCFIKDTRSL